MKTLERKLKTGFAKLKLGEMRGGCLEYEI